ncbi:MAG: AraC family transcriptional regulator [Clostridia bacterium]|nr:AraC family transcriptional regulator [Clostridia bacterium]
MRIEKTYEIICVTKGTVCMYEEKREYVAERGQVILLSPNLLHGGTAVTRDVGFYWVHFTVEDGEFPIEKRFFESFESRYLFKELLHYNNLPNIPEYAVNSVLIHILSELCHLSQKSTQSYNIIAEQLYEWIRISASAELTVKSLADHLGYSPDHINRICKKYHGIGARELINRFLIARAKSLLCNTEKYVKEIAAELKFSNDKAFIGYFKYHEGCSPSEFRNRFGKIHMNTI